LKIIFGKIIYPYLKKNHDDITILYPLSRETRESELPQVFEDTGIKADKVQRVFSTDSDNPFAEFQATL